MIAMLTYAERLTRVRRIRRYALKLLGYYVILLPMTLPLSLLAWIGERAEAVFEWVDLPAYRMRSAQEELRRELVRDNRRRQRMKDGYEE